MPTVLRRRGVSRHAGLPTLRRELEEAHAEAARQAQEQELARQEQEALTQRFEQERRDLLAEAERLRQLAGGLQAERDQLAAAGDQQEALPSHAEVWRRFDELAARAETQRVEMERLHEEIAAAAQQPEAEPAGVLGRLFGRAPAPRRLSSDPGGLARRIDSMRVDVAVERERALRVVAEMAKANLERQLSDALAQLRQASERAVPAAPAGNLISLPHGGGPAGPTGDYRDFLTPPASPPKSSTPGRPRRVEGPI